MNAASPPKKKMESGGKAPRKMLFGNDFSSIIALLNRKISVNAWMGKQQCQWAVRRVLEKIGDEKILLQCDGYESFLNALESVNQKTRKVRLES